MINLDLKKNTDDEAGAVLQIVGEMTLEHAAEMKQALLELIAETGGLSIDCAQVERVDLAGLQLLCSAVRSCSEQQRAISIVVAALPVFQQALANAGFPADWLQLFNAEPGQEASPC